MLKTDLMEVLEILKANNGPSSAVALLEEMLDKGNYSELDLIDRNSYVATVLWNKEDIIEAIRYKCYDVTEENICKVINSLDIGSLTDCSDGWDVIYKAVDDALDSSVTEYQKHENRENNWELHEVRNFAADGGMENAFLLVKDIDTKEEVFNVQLQDDVWQFEWTAVGEKERFTNCSVGEVLALKNLTS